MKNKIGLIAIIIAIVAVIGFLAINYTNSNRSNESKAVPQLKTSKYVDLKGIYVDKSDEQEHPDEALIYVLYTVKSDDRNIKFYTYMASNPGTALTIKINGINEYIDTIYSGHIKQNFRDTGYENLNNGQKVLAGTSLDCIGAFRVAKNDLKEGGIIELTLNGTDSFNEIFEYKTDDVQYYDNAEEILKVADPDTYEKVKQLNEEKLADIDENLRNQIDTVLHENYYYWYTSTIRTQLAFQDNNFIITAAGISNGGTYEIRNKVILLHYNNGGTNQLPYEFANGEVTLTGTPE